MVNKSDAIMEHLLDRDLSVVFVSETWLKSDENLVTSLVKTYGYILLHNRRKNREKDIGGGVGILNKNGLEYKHMSYKSYSSFKLCVVKLHLGNRKPISLVCIYRLLFVSITVFLKEIVQLLEVLVASNDDIVIAGDVNIHLDEDELYSNNFKDILNMFNIRQHVDFPTHKMGHTLDIIATFYDNPAISNISAEEYDISDHFLVDFKT